jgi:hypothetical protein
MLDKWVFEVGLVELAIGCIICIFVLRQQLKTFAVKSELQPIKYLLFGTVILLILAHVPLMFVYADTLWWDFTSRWIVYMAILANSTSMILVSTFLYLIYRDKKP